MPEYFIVGGGTVKLGPEHFVAQGGEASVFARGDRAYKLYTDPAHMVPAAKVRELAALSHPAVIRPEALLLDAKNRPVGYAMRRVRGGHPLCRLFNRGFRDRMRIAPDQVAQLVERLREGMAHVHGHGILIVDLNETNFLLDTALKDVLFIDVDSYQTPGFPATALMDSVRDRHATGFSRETDWFAFGIVSFQMFVGIHPYKGKHPTLPDLDARMKANVSVLNPAVSVPPVCYPLSQVPQAYRDWYRALFEEGKRLPPPVGLRPAVLLPPDPVLAAPVLGDHVVLRELARFPAPVVEPVAWLPAAALTTEGLYFRGRTHATGPGTRLARTPRLARLVAGWIEDGRLRLYDPLDGRFLPDALQADELTGAGDRLVLRQEDRLCEVELLELPAGLRATLRTVGNALPQATRLYEGAAFQDLSGAAHVSLFPAPGTCRTIRLRELDGHRIADLRFDNDVLMAAASRDGKLRRLRFRFDREFGSYDTAVEEDVPLPGLDFVTLDSGVCVRLRDDGDLELFPRRPGVPDTRRVSAPELAGGKPFRDGTQVLFVRGTSVYEATLGGK